MARLTCTAFAPDGEPTRLSDPIRWELIRSWDSPADGFLAVFPLDAPLPAFARLTADYEGEPVFDGLVDEQETRCSGTGCLVTISARSRGALLLDNEARPARYEKPALQDLYRLHGAPYGLTGLDGEARCPAAFSVEKGMSEWEVLLAFCQGVMDVTPRLTPALRLDARGLPQPGEPLVFSNRDGIAYTDARVEQKRCALRSEILCKPEGAGGYLVRVPDDQARASGVRARRFLHLASLPVWQRDRLPGLLLRAARREAFSIRLRVPFGFTCTVGRAARLDGGPLGTFERLLVTQTEHRVGPDGAFCTVTLHREEDVK